MVLFFTSLAFAPNGGIPHLINYQGMLTDDFDNSVTDTLDLTFRIFDVESSGDSLWGETQEDVPVIDGLFNVLLGSVNSIDLPFDEDYWLEIEVGGGEVLTPRIQLTSVGYAYRAEMAETAGSDGDWTISDNDMYSAVSGNVGIGITTPTAPLTIKPIVGTDILFDGSLSNADIKSTTQFKVGTQNPHPFSIITSNADRLWVASDGKVGIGTASPAEKLDVDGTAQMTGFKMPSGASAGYVLTSDASGVGTWLASGGIGGSGNTNYIPKFTSSTTVGNSAIYQLGSRIGIGTTLPTVPLHVESGGVSTGFRLNNTEADGDVFIAFDLNGVRKFCMGVDDSDGDKLKIGTSSHTSNVRLAIDAAGNVGMGTTDPVDNLHIYENTNGFMGIRIENPNTGSSSSEGIYFNNEDGSVAGIRLHDEGSSYPQRMHIFNNRPNGTLYFATAGYDRMVIANNGMVGIGDFSPSYRLELPDVANTWGRARANAWHTYSSREEKKDISALDPEDYAAVLKEIVEMEMVYYRYKKQDDDRLYLGVIAEDAPEQIVAPDRKSLSLSEFTAFAMAGLKAQQAEIEQLKKEIQILRQESKK